VLAVTFHGVTALVVYNNLHVVNSKFASSSTEKSLTPAKRIAGTKPYLRIQNAQQKYGLCVQTLNCTVGELPYK
jgi:hypothetical protein